MKAAGRKDGIRVPIKDGEAIAADYLGAIRHRGTSLPISRGAREALEAVAEGSTVPQRFASLVAFGELAGLKLIEPDERRLRWLPSASGWALLGESLRCLACDDCSAGRLCKQRLPR